MLKAKVFILLVAATALISMGGCTEAKQESQNDSEKTPPSSAQIKQEKEELREVLVLKDETGEVVKPKVVISGTESLYENAVIVSQPEDLKILVNRTYNLPSDYKASDLVRVDIPFVDGRMEEVKFMRADASQALNLMFAGAKEAGYQLAGASGYRSYSIQTSLFSQNITRKGSVEKANAVSALPGQSEHQTGLAMDITSESANYALLENFADTDEGKWLSENAHTYGFILRYPKGKEQITGYNYEPWHFRYIGVETATKIYEKQQTLEEYYGKV